MRDFCRKRYTNTYAFTGDTLSFEAVAEPILIVQPAFYDSVHREIFTPARNHHLSGDYRGHRINGGREKQHR